MSQEDKKTVAIYTLVNGSIETEMNAENLRDELFQLIMSNNNLSIQWTGRTRLRVW